MSEEMQYVDENGYPLPRWKPLAPETRGRHRNFSSAVEAVFKDLITERNDFFDSLADRWPTLFPNCPARPGRWDDGKLYLYVRSAPALFAFRPRLAAVKRTLSSIPGAPKRLNILLEIHR